MKELIIYTFGTSDLYLDGEKVKDNFKEITERLLDNFGDNKITFPIFENLIEKLGNNKEYLIVGIFTKQNPIHNLDTYNLEKIFEKYLFKKYQKIRLSKKNIILDEANKHVIIYKKIRDFIKDKFVFFEEFERMNVSITGGTKGIVIGTFQACLASFKISKISFFNVDENSGIAIESINIKDDIILNQEKNDIKIMLENYDFYGIYNYTKNKPNFENIKKLSKYGFKLLDFDIKMSNEIYNEFLEKQGIELPIYFRGNILDIIENSLNGLFYTYKTDKLVEFLGRIYSFSDILTNYLINNYLQFNLGESKQYEKLNSFIVKNNLNDLKQFLNNYKVDGKYSLNWDINNEEHKKSFNGDKINFLNLIIKKAILEYYLEKEKKDGLKNYLDFINKIESLNKYRNKTIIAHGIEPVSKEIISQNYSGDILEDIKELYKSIIKRDKFFFELLNEQILKLI